MGQRSRAFLLRYGGVARRKNEIARRYGSGCRRLDGRDDRHRSRDIGRIGQTRRLYRRGSGRNFSYRGFRRIEILYLESRSPQEHDFQSQRVDRLQREHGAFHSVHPRPHLFGHAQGCRSRYRLSPRSPKAASFLPMSTATVTKSTTCSRSTEKATAKSNCISEKRGGA